MGANVFRAASVVDMGLADASMVAIHNDAYYFELKYNKEMSTCGRGSYRLEGVVAMTDSMDVISDSYMKTYTVYIISCVCTGSKVEFS